MKHLYFIPFALFTLACGSASLFSGQPTATVRRVAVLDQYLTATASAEKNQSNSIAQATATSGLNNNTPISDNVVATPVATETPAIPQDTPTMTYNSAAFATAAAIEQQLILEETPVDNAVTNNETTPTNTPANEATATAIANNTATPTMTGQAGVAAVATGSPTATATPSATLMPGVTPTVTATPTPSLTPTPIPTQPAASPKKGVGVTHNGQFACADMGKLRASWYHTWDIYPDNSCNTSAFVPRVYNGNSLDKLDQIMEMAKASGWVMGFTEPNLSWQANMTPGEGAEVWHQVEEAASKAGVKLVSPSPNQFEPGQQEPYGHQWTWAMVAEYEQLYGKKPHFDAIGWNIYRSTPARTKAYLTARHEEALKLGYDVPVWVLEYGGECWNTATNNTGNDQIMAEITPWLDSTPWIGRYAWFANRLSGGEGEAVGWQSCSLINFQTGELTSLGQMYQAR